MKPVWKESSKPKTQDAVVGGYAQGDQSLRTAPPAAPVATHTGSVGKRVESVAARIMTASAPLSEKDSRYVDLSDVLPSGFSFYDFENLSARPCTALEVQKMHRSVLEQNIKHQIDAISACLDQSAYRLTLGDFQFLMYWTRLNSFKKHPVNLVFRCNHPTHLTKVGEGKLPVESLDQKYQVKASQVKERKLDFAACDEYMRNFHEEYALYLWTPMVSDLIEGMLPDTTADEDWWNKYAGMLNPMHHGASLAERRAVLLQVCGAHDNSDIVEDMEQWSKLCEHGVEEYVEVKCQECGVLVEKQHLRIDPLMFLVFQ